ncbi:hypothetical protein F5879DRAFT_663635 [Lentinula edodes]|nr:hypothetical protein F5879DRAFT_663635 [Lentinula edodes]
MSQSRSGITVFLSTAPQAEQLCCYISILLRNLLFRCWISVNSNLKGFPNFKWELYATILPIFWMQILGVIGKILNMSGEDPGSSYQTQFCHFPWPKLAYFRPQKAQSLSEIAYFGYLLADLVAQWTYVELWHRSLGKEAQKSSGCNNNSQKKCTER